MVNRKSRNAYFLSHGSPRKKLLGQITKKHINITHPKGAKNKKVKKNNYPRRYLDNSVSKLKSIFTTIVGEETEFIANLTTCVNLNQKMRIENRVYIIISDIHQIIIVNSAVGKMMITKSHLINALKCLLSDENESVK